MRTNNRRHFIKTSLTAVAGLALNPVLSHAFAQPVVLQFVQEPLKYPFNAFEPYIDALTTEIHYTKHHTAYIKNVNEAIAAEKIPYTTVEAFFENAASLSAKARNNGGGAWNHNFFFATLKPGSTSIPGGKLKAAIDKAFGSVDRFKEQFAQAAATRFGSGWAWLVNDKGRLKITSTANQDNPLFGSAEVKGTPLLALDVWEHAYYLKYQNKRADYIANFWNVVDWEVVAGRLT